MLERTSGAGSLEEQIKNLSRNRKGDGRAMGRYGRLTVIALSRDASNRSIATCSCECGAMTTKRLTALVNGYTKSCGCLKRETASANGKANVVHGHSSPSSRSPEYRSWESARARCRNQANPDFDNYGGRGIAFSEAWDDFEVFLRDMGPRPRGHTLDRIDVNGNYEPGNCRWATDAVQGRNKRRNRVVIWQGVPLTLVELSERTGAPYNRLHERIVRYGWPVERAVKEAPRGFR